MADRWVAGRTPAAGKSTIAVRRQEVHSKLVADRLTFLALGEVIGKGTKEDLAGEDIRHLMAGGVEMADLEQEIAAI